MIKKILFFLIVLSALGALTGGVLLPDPARSQSGRTARGQLWEIQSIDTMKYSRDRAREALANTSFDETIERQIAAIAETGANFVAIGTPYDQEFLPVLRRWVTAARRHGLRVWFRGNWSGWESWFGYAKINTSQHIAKTRAFILNNPTLFSDGDMFTPCPECENGALGDPRFSGKLKEFREFLIALQSTSEQAFAKIGKQVQVGFHSMNGDVAALTMDAATTRQLGGRVTIDHYVSSIPRLTDDISRLAKQGGAPVVLGEFGAPIPDIHGALNAEQQSDWIAQALNVLARNAELQGLNYWVNVDGSTALWESDGQARPAVANLKKFFTPAILYGSVITATGKAIPNARVETEYRKIFTDEFGTFILPFITGYNTTVTASYDGFRDKSVTVIDPTLPLTVQLEPQRTTILFYVKIFLQRVTDWLQ